MRNYYRLLNVYKSASMQEITAAYEKLRKQAARDQSPRNAAYYALLPEIYKILISSVKRQEYNLQLENAVNSIPFCIKTSDDYADTLPDQFPDGLLNHLYNNTDHLLEAWENETLRNQIDEWDWVEFAIFNTNLGSHQLGLAICQSNAIANWSTHNIFRLAYDMTNHRPDFCLTLLENKAAAAHLTGSQLLALANKFGLEKVITSDKLFRFKYDAAYNLRTLTPAQLRLEPNEEIEVINEHYILGKCAIYQKKDDIALKYFLRGAASLHIPSLRELIKHPQATLEHLKISLENCERLDKNFTAYDHLKNQILKRLLEYFDAESNTTFLNNHAVDKSHVIPEKNASILDLSQLHFYDLLKIRPQATLTEIHSAHEKITKESHRNTRTENETYYNEADKAYAALINAKPLTLVEKTKQHLDTPFLKNLNDNPQDAIDMWKSNRQKVLQWQWYELLKNNRQLAYEISSSQTLGSWCSFIIFKLASLDATTGKNVLKNISASIALSGSELCQLIALYPNLKSIITENEHLSSKYYAANIIAKNNHLVLMLAKDETVEKINPNYILAKKFLHEKIIIAAIHYLKEAVKSGHINSYYELIRIGSQDDIKFSIEACPKFVNPNLVDYSSILSLANKMLLVSVNGQTGKKAIFDDLGDFTLSDHPNAFFNANKEASTAVTNDMAYKINEETLSYANSPKRSPSPSKL